MEAVTVAAMKSLFVLYFRYYRLDPRSRDSNENHMRNFLGWDCRAWVAGGRMARP